MGPRFVLLLIVFSFIYIFFIVPNIFPSRNIHAAGNVIGDSSRYREAIELGGEWFLNNQDDKFLYYSYDTRKRMHPQKKHDLRQTASMWSITKMYNFTGDQRYLDLAYKGLRHYEKYLETDTKDNFMYLNVTPEAAKLGYSAFMILSLLGTGYPNRDRYVNLLANGIMHQQAEDGSLKTHFYSEKNTGVDYYPGEALVAIMTLYEETKNRKYLDFFKDASAFYRIYWEENPNTAFVPWQTRAHLKYYKATGDGNVPRFIFNMNDFIIDSYSADGKCSEFVFHGIVAAVHMEGVNKAYELARMVNDTKRMRCYSNFIKKSSSYLLSLQVTDKENYEKEAIGGFLGSERDPTQRVDRNQHAVMALIDAHELGLI